jgi:hypothetical protein
VDRSFQLFKGLLLAHSVQRPPYSIGLFTFSEMKAILEWALDTYFRHYKLYMYAFTDRVLMSVEQAHPLDIVEIAPGIPSLNDAMTEEQHAEVVSEEQRKVSGAGWRVRRWGLAMNMWGAGREQTGLPTNFPS